MKDKIKLLQFEGFNDRVNQLSNKEGTYKKAFYKTREECKDTFGYCRWNSYESFKSQRGYYRRKKRK